LSFFISNSLKNVLDEKTYLTQDSTTNSNSVYAVKTNDKILFSKKNFETLTFNKNSDLKSISFFLTLDQVNNILFQKSSKLEITTNSDKHIFLLKILKIAKVDDNKYYCQYKISGESND